MVAIVEEGRGANVQRTLDMMAMQGFSGTRFGLCTRRAFSGGRRIGLCAPDIVVDCVCGARIETSGQGTRKVVMSRGCERRR